MDQNCEFTLSVIDGASETERLVVVLCPARDNQLELRQQSWGEGIGWFTQSCVQLEARQAKELCGALGGVRTRPDSFSAQPSSRRRNLVGDNPPLRIVRAASA